MKTNLYVLFGPPGSGKSTQALLLADKLGLVYISWGQLSRDIIAGKKQSELYQIVKEYTEHNRSFPDGTISRIL